MRVNTTDKGKCCGCSACVVVCPQQCIAMVADQEGFNYPVIDEAQCIECGKCLKVCGMQNETDLHEVKESYAAWHLDNKKRAASTSGGAYSALAESFLEAGGLVAGAAFTDGFKGVEHRLVKSWDDAKDFRGSKYIQSETLACFRAIKDAVNQGKKVLFTGTPCQVASLRRLTGDSSCLTTCDIVCHGVPSAKVFQSYLAGIIHSKKDLISFVEFRNKDKGWNFSQIKIKFKNSSSITKPPWSDRYMTGFYLNILLRPSCFQCPFKKTERSGDLTLGDCWRIAAKHPELDDNKGTSLLTVNTEKTKKHFEKLKKGDVICANLIDYGDACKNNAPFYSNLKEHYKREQFFKLFTESGDFRLASSVYFSSLEAIVKYMKRLVKICFWSILQRYQ